MKQGYDVVVVGAGPAGATLAYELAKKGIGVLLLEKEKLPRYKPCAGGVTSKATKVLNFDISDVTEDVIYEVSFAFNLGSPLVRRHTEPLVYTVMRDAFDYLLAKRAEQAGAVLKDGLKVTQIQISADRVEVAAGDDVFHSQFIIGADGAYSVVARELGMELRMEYVAGMESEIVVSGEDLAKWKSRVQMDLGCVPGGYAWVFPKRNHLSIGVACPAMRARQLNRYHEKFLNSPGVGNYQVVRSSSHLIPTCTKGSVIWRDRALLVGDAAGLADPLTGEGIYHAILSAQLAAPVIESALAHDKRRLQDYQRAVDDKIMPELRIARVLSRFFVRFPHLAFSMLRRSDGAWRAGCRLICGESNYADIKEMAGGFKGIFNRLFRM